MTEIRRPDMQGLRAVAVLSVMLFHAGVTWMPGGFVGVDVFFVLSGFFISRILMRDIREHGHIRLARFWAKRAKRLLPNALLVILCVVTLSAAILPTYQLEGISSDAVASAAFFANFHFAARAIDYFHLDDPASPLLHYWSLAVEEQFYLVLPLLMTPVAWFARRNARHVVAILLVIIVIASLAASIIMLEQNQPFAFFHPQYRAWQLAVGGLAGMVFEKRHKAPVMLREMGIVLGALAVLASVLMLSEQLPYPGFRALFPTLGTAAVILGLDAGRISALLSAALSQRPMVMIGNWSYSLYLWHWPVGIFLAGYWPSPGAGLTVTILIVSFVLGVIAYYAVENPVHRMPLAAGGVWRLLAGSAAAIAVSAGLGASLSTIPGQTDPQVAARIAEASSDLGPNYRNGCHVPFRDIGQPECRFGPAGAPRVVLFGDSHAAQWFTPLTKAAEDEGWQVQAWTKTSCPSGELTIWYVPTRSVYEECSAWRNDRIRELVANPPELVIISNSTRWHGWLYDSRKQTVADRAETDRLWQDGFDALAKRLGDANIPIVELRDTPEMYRSFKNCLSLSEWTDCYRERRDATNGSDWKIGDRTNASRVDLTDAICGPGRCYATKGEMILYRDSHHLTATFATTLAPFIADVLKAARPQHSNKD